MQERVYQLRGKAYLWSASASWHFVNVSKAKAKEIEYFHSHIAAGFGSIPVQVTVGNTIWKTSIFPSKKDGTYLLPLKAAVRKAEDIEAGDSIGYSLRIAM